jgi:hypothetical protein
MSADQRIRISLRECRMTVERVLMVAGVDASALPAAVDLVVAAQLASGDALALLEREVLPGSVAGAVLTTDADGPGPPVVDAGGASSLIALPAVLDLACAGRREGAGVAMALDVTHTAFAAGLVPLAARRGLEAEVVVALRGGRGERYAGPARCDGLAGSGDLRDAAAALLDAHPEAAGCVVVAVAEAPGPAADDAVAGLVGDPYVANMIRDGADVDAPLWWSLFERSELALSPASERSRLDTGVLREDPTEDDPDAH